MADDIEDSSSVRTIDGRNATYDWLVSDTIPAGDLEKLRVVVLGTFLHEDSIMMRLKKEIEDGRRSGVFRRYPIIDEEGNILWKGKYPDMAAIEAEKRQIVSERAWNQEFLLRGHSDQDRVISPDMIHYYEDKDMPAMTRENHYRGAFIGVDPALSESERACNTAMIAVRVFGWGDSMRMYVMPHPVNEKMGAPAVIEKMKAISSLYAWNGTRALLYIEDVGYQKALIQLLEADGYRAKGVHPQGDKRSRLGMISPAVKNAVVLFPTYGVDALMMQMTNSKEELVNLEEGLLRKPPALLKL